MIKKFIEYIKRNKRKKKFKVYFDEDSFGINDYKVTPVHLIPENISYNQEFDFYISTNYDAYLLRLINSNEENGIIYPIKDDGVIYIVCKTYFDKDTMINSIDKTLNSLREEYGFPKLQNPNCSVKFKFF